MTKHELLKKLEGRLAECENGLKEAPGNSAILVRKLEVETTQALVSQLTRIHGVTLDEMLVRMFNQVVAEGQRVVYFHSSGHMALGGEVAGLAYFDPVTDHAVVRLKGLDEPVPVAFVFHVPGMTFPVAQGSSE